MKHGNSNTNSPTTTNVVDFVEIRNQRSQDKQRKHERVLMKNILGVYCVVGEQQIRQIEILDLSDEGCSFMIPKESSKPWTLQTENIPIRLYFGQDHYLEVFATIQREETTLANHTVYTRYGCSINTTTQSYGAYLKFVDFLKSYALASKEDLGNCAVYF